MDNGNGIAMRCLWNLAVLAGCLLAETALGAEVVTYPAPAGETLSADYDVRVDGKKVDVYTARVLDPPFAGKQWDFGGAYAFANFDLSGQVTVRIKSPRSLRSTVVRPQSPAISIKVEDEHTLLLTLDGPRKLSIEPDGKKGPLLLFANPIEKDPPKAKGAGVIYYGPGIHKAGLITVRDNQTLYLAGGAVVHGAIAAQGKNIRICGRGILDGSDYEWRKGPHPYTIGIYGSDIELDGITVRGSSHWTVVSRNSRRVTIRVENVRVHGEGKGQLIRLRPVVNQYMRKKVPGFIRTVCFKDFQVYGMAGRYQVQLAGADAEHDVRTVTFENVSVLDIPLVRDSPRVSINPYVTEVQFSVSPAGRTPQAPKPRSP